MKNRIEVTLGRPGEYLLCIRCIMPRKHRSLAVYRFCCSYADKASYGYVDRVDPILRNNTHTRIYIDNPKAAVGYIRHLIETVYCSNPIPAEQVADILGLRLGPPT